MDKKQKLFSVAFFVAIAGLYATNYAGSAIQVSGVADTTNSLGTITVIRDYVPGRDGFYLFGFKLWSYPTTFYIHNAVTNIWLNQTRDIRMGTQGTVNTTIASILLSSGTTAPAATDTTCEATVLTGSGADPVNATIYLNNTDQGSYYVQNKFLFSGSVTVAKICLSNYTATTSPLFASGLLSAAQSYVNTENMTIIYNQKIS